jgi:TolB-like protein/tetratricopeptide (TPR) repeat protein
MRDGGTNPERVVRFGVFEADLDSGELRRRGARVRLQERPFRILVALLARPNEVVSRQELRDTLWSADTFVDFDHGLDAAVNKLREALGDSAASARFIETLPRRGYRFLAAPFPYGTAPSLEDRRRRLAVLPFVNATADPENEPFCEGLTQEMIIRLGRLLKTSVGVIATNSVTRYRDGDRSPDRVGRELGVDWVLDGTLRRMNGRLRIGAQLVEVAGRTLLWADTWEGDAKDEFALQREIAIHAAGSLAREVLPPGDDPTPAQPALVSRSRERYVVGQHWLAARTHDGFRKALGYFREAVAADPRCAESLAGIAQTYILGLEYGVFQPDEAIPGAKESLLRALEVDPMVSDGHLILGFIRHRHDFDWEGAESSFLHARQLNPSCADTLRQYAELLSHLLRHDEAIAAIRLSRRLDPHALMLGAEECCILVNAGRADEGLCAVARVHEMDQHFPIAHHSRARALLALDRPNDAFAACGNAMERGSQIPLINATRGVAAARAGRPDEAWQALARLESPDFGSYVSRVQLARVHAALGRADDAVALLEDAHQRRDAEITELRSEPEWRVLHSHPGYLALVERLAFPG